MEAAEHSVHGGFRGAMKVIVEHLTVWDDLKTAARVSEVDLQKDGSRMRWKECKGLSDTLGLNPKSFKFLAAGPWECNLTSLNLLFLFHKMAQTVPVAHEYLSSAQEPGSHWVILFLRRWVLALRKGGSEVLYLQQVKLNACPCTVSSFTSCVTLNKLLNLFLPQFPDL